MHILLVDDNSLVLEDLAATLEVAGHHVITFSRGKDLIQHVQENPVCDVIVTDKNMPKMDGFEVLTTLRNNKALDKTPIIMHTSEPGLEPIVKKYGGLYAEKVPLSKNLLNLLRKIENGEVTM
ncbi:hypothetical protein A3A35_02340 [Candidatus Kaiserbacteria bacterium RIFCSPLOWO2_01_FULL_51_21]|uniref:Response regulatory domain-containing protein n=1 Tax=Candidatus Kaiserbacteria bacterium RIFCSPLOWO2_01_FULL_51_21 TaxID=1798508 RepID=A0A1F6EEK0_9BACT|nr:MAG: hypothetical protein A3A35_02340 [Candidatus Kaiserbacteria bacterium RIFCSPLOWO2_01_FULL_51_21]